MGDKTVTTTNTDTTCRGRKGHHWAVAPGAVWGSGPSVSTTEHCTRCGAGRRTVYNAVDPRSGLIVGTQREYWSLPPEGDE